MTTNKKPTAKKAAKKAAKPKKNFDTLVVGATYRTRDGDTVKIRRVAKLGGVYPFSDGELTYTVEGNLFVGGVAEGDLIELISLPEPKEEPKPAIKLEVGKTYPTREGGTALVVADNINTCQDANFAAVVTRPDGRVSTRYFLRNGNCGVNLGPNPEDIILPDAHNFPWAVMPKWAKWVANSADHGATFFENKPAKYSEYHGNSGGSAGSIPPAYLPDWYKSLPWDQSLLERPENV